MGRTPYDSDNCFELLPGSLQQRDSVHFRIKSSDYTFEGKILECFINSEGASNAEIFYKLGLNKRDFCSEAYGWRAGGGDWPVTGKGSGDPENDWALTRVSLLLWGEEKKRERGKGSLQSTEFLIDPSLEPRINKFLEFAKQVPQNNSEAMWEAASYLIGLDLMPLRGR